MHSPSSALAAGLATLVLAFGTVSCESGAAGTASSPSAPVVVDATALTEHLRPTGSERALLVNFWATW